jgi:hypothetical protein
MSTASSPPNPRSAGKAQDAPPTQSNPESTLPNIRSEAKRIRQGSLSAAERHYAAETPWFYLIYSLGITSTFFAACAGVLTFWDHPSSKYVVGGISVVAAILSALLTFLDPAKRATEYHKTAKAYEALYHKAGFFLRFELLSETTDIATSVAKLESLHSQFTELNLASPVLSNRAYRVARSKMAKRIGEVVRAPEDVEEDGDELALNNPRSRSQ